jgi:tRNA modification GTPase
LYPLDDTIAAVASAPGGAARGIVRLSGPAVCDCLRNYFQAESGHSLASIIGPTVFTGRLKLPGFHSSLPCELYLWPQGRSYTGQFTAEIHTLGSPPLLEAVVAALCEAGARPAGPGEFTLRAFLAGRIDLTQAEAVLGAIDAADPNALRIALEQMAGGLAAPLHRLRDSLLDLLAHLEAGMDFADEDLPFLTKDDLLKRLDEAAKTVAQIAGRMESRGQTAGPARVAIVGPPNAGKSSLFNALVGDAGAIVSDQPGATRDYLTAALQLDGVSCQLIDTAGLDGGDTNTVFHSGPDSPAARAINTDEHEIQRAAMDFALEQGRRAQVRIRCLDGAAGAIDRQPDPEPNDFPGACITVWTKADLARPREHKSGAIVVSSRTGEGLRDLKEAIKNAILQSADPRSAVVDGTAVRCRRSLEAAAECLGRASALVQQNRGEELIAAEIGGALESLGEVVGAVHADDVLDRVFSRFCIGK